MRAGELRHKVKLQEYTILQNTYGEATKVWTTYATVWARIQPLKGNEALLAQQIKAELSHRLTIRYNSSVKAKHRVKFNERIFDVNSVRNLDERNVEQELMVKEAVE